MVEDEDEQTTMFNPSVNEDEQTSMFNSSVICTKLQYQGYTHGQEGDSEERVESHF